MIQMHGYASMYHPLSDMAKGGYGMLNTAQALQKLLCHAYQTVPFYQHLIADNMDAESMEFGQLPVTDKEQMVKSGDSMLSSRYIGKYIANQLHWTRTSGSSGILHEIYWDPNDEKKSLKSLWLLRKKYYGISPAQKLCYFFPSDIEADKYKQKKNILAVSRSVLYDGSLEEAYQKIRQYQPEWMILQPSIALLLCSMAEQYGVWDALAYIEFTGEYLELPVRERVETVFKCKTANQYGTKEVNSIAYECPAGKMHIMSDNVYLETIEDNLCVTSLRNYAMPFVKYRLEDRGRIRRDVHCQCGRCGDILSLHAGRSNDYIRLADGKRMHAYALMQMIHHINYQYDGCIIQYRIIQKDYYHFLFQVVLAEDDCNEEMQAWMTEVIAKEVNERIRENCKTDVCFIKDILPEEQMGKCRVFQTEIA